MDTAAIPAQLPLTFKRSESLKSRKVMEQMFTLNQHLKVPPFKLVWLAEPNDTGFKLMFAVSVSKRMFKTAVMRNRIKRCLREAYRLQKPEIYKLFDNKQVTLNVMLIFQGQHEVPPATRKTALMQAFSRLARKINQA